MTTTPHLQCSDLHKRYGDNIAVDGVSFAIEAGECLGVIGPNGAGKTTTLRMCLGLTTPDSGRIQAFGMDMPADDLAIKARLGVVSQFDTLDPDFTCAENLLVFGRYFGLPDATIRSRIPQLLEFGALSHKADAKPGELSGGMKRRLSLARALISDPALLLLDEPFAGMNHDETMKAVSMVCKLRERGLTVLLVEHDMQAVMKISDRIVVLNFGEKIAEGTPSEIQNNQRVIEAYLGVEDEAIGL